MTAASDKALQALHNKLATVMHKSLSNCDRAEELLGKDRDEPLPDDIVAFLEQVSTINPALLTAVTKFLKDNDVTCQIDQDDTMTDLQIRLQNKRKRLADLDVNTVVN